MVRRVCFLVGCLAAASLVSGQEVSGELKAWHKVTLDYQGPQTSETGIPNPFTDYRLEVIFTGPSGQTNKVPGYFAADGNAAETGAQSGGVWRVHVAPDAAGTWTYVTFFRSGADVALSTDPAAGSPAAPLDGMTGSFDIAPTDKTGRDHRGKGMLRYVQKHHLQFAGTKEYFLKGGADSPENFLACADFDNTPDNGGRRKTWSPHVVDWREGDPTWNGGKGKGMIGALNYLSGKGVNAFSFIPMNLYGDDKNVFPYISENTADWTRFDCSKLDQWEIVFSHADKMGLHMNFKTLEEENHDDLDGGALGRTRKAYYRELVARFGHHLALNWNLGEEVNFGDHGYTIEELRSFAQYFRDIDPYDHHIMCTTFPTEHDVVYAPMLGNLSEMTGAGLQTDWNNVYTATRKWVEESDKAGKSWVVANDEQGHYYVGVKADADDPWHPGIRKETLWGNLMAGGAGVEYYFGWQNAINDLTAEDYRSRDQMWDLTRYALEFFSRNTPFWEMSARDGIASRGRCLAKPGECYAVHLPAGGSCDVNLTGYPGYFRLSWYNPRNGFFAGTAKVVSGGGIVNTGNPPEAASEDWAVLIRKDRNLVLNKPATASNVYGSGYEAAKAVDGNTGTRWATMAVTTATLDIDFGTSTAFDSTVINEGSWNRIRSYQIQYWNGSSWVTAHTGGDPANIQADKFAAVTGSKVRLNITSATTEPTIWEFEVYNSGISVPAQTPYNGPHAIAGGATLQVEDFDNGGEGVAYHDNDATNNGGQYRSTEGVDIETCSAGGYDVGWINTNEWLEYTCNVTAGTYDVTLHMATPYTSTYAVRLYQDGALKATFNVTTTGGWQTWSAVTVSNVSLSAGSASVLRLESANGGVNLNKIEFSASASDPLTIQCENYTAQSGCSVSSSNGGYTGRGYLDMGGNGSYGEWNNVTCISAGTKTILIRYANGGAANRPCEVTVNGTSAGTLDFTPTSGWSTWGTASVTVPMNAGNNTVRVTASTTAGGPNLDKFDKN